MRTVLTRTSLQAPLFLLRTCRAFEKLPAKLKKAFLKEEESARHAIYEEVSGQQGGDEFDEDLDTGFRGKTPSTL